MSETLEQTWEEELMERGEARGQLAAHRENLRLLLEERFGPLPEELLQRIERTTDVERLRAALRQVLHVTALSELEI